MLVSVALISIGHRVIPNDRMITLLLDGIILVFRPILNCPCPIIYTNVQLMKCVIIMNILHNKYNKYNKCH